VVKGLLIKFLLVSGVVLLCVFSIKDNRGAKAVLRVRHFLNRQRIMTAKSGIEQKLKDTYAEIGRRYSTGDIRIEKVRAEMDSLAYTSGQYCLQINEQRKQLLLCDRKLEERMSFEELLSGLFCRETAKRIQSLRALSQADLRRSLPYIGLLLVDIDPPVQRSAAQLLTAVMGSLTKEMRMSIPNLDRLKKESFTSNIVDTEKDNLLSGSVAGQLSDVPAVNVGEAAEIKRPAVTGITGREGK